MYRTCIRKSPPELVLPVVTGSQISVFVSQSSLKAYTSPHSGILLALDVVDQISWKIKLVRHCVDQGRQSDTQESTWDLRFIRQLFWHEYQSLAAEPFNEFPPWLSKSIPIVYFSTGFVPTFWFGKGDINHSLSHH